MKGEHSRRRGLEGRVPGHSISWGLQDEEEPAEAEKSSQRGGKRTKLGVGDAKGK